MQSHYNIEPSEDGLSYTFVTKNNIKYKVALTIYPLGEVSAFSLAVYPDEGFEPHPGLDLRIKNTIAKIVGDILLMMRTQFFMCAIRLMIRKISATMYLSTGMKNANKITIMSRK